MRHVVLFALSLWPGPGSADDLELPKKQVEAGQILFLELCSRCHGRDASGGNAPDIQGVLVKDVKAAARGVEAMPEIALSETEAGQIAVYLMFLAPDQARVRLGLK